MNQAEKIKLMYFMLTLNTLLKGNAKFMKYLLIFQACFQYSVLWKFVKKVIVTFYNNSDYFFLTVASLHRAILAISKFL